MIEAPPTGPLAEPVIQSSNGMRGFVVSNDFSGATTAPQIDVKSAVAQDQSVGAIGQGVQNVGGALGAIIEIRQHALDVNGVMQANLKRSQYTGELQASQAAEPDVTKWPQMTADFLDAKAGSLVSQNMSPSGQDQVIGANALWRQSLMSRANLDGARAVVSQNNNMFQTQFSGYMANKQYPEATNTIDRWEAAGGLNSGNAHQYRQGIEGARNGTNVSNAMAIVADPEQVQQPGSLDRARALINDTSLPDDSKGHFIGVIDAAHATTMQVGDVKAAIINDALDVQRELQDPKSTKWNLLSQGQRADLSLEAQRSQAKVASSTFDIVKDAIDQGRFDMSTGKLEGAGAKQMTEPMIDELKAYQIRHDQNILANDPETYQRMSTTIQGYSKLGDASGLHQAEIATAIAANFSGPARQILQAGLTERANAQQVDMVPLAPVFQWIDNRASAGAFGSFQRLKVGADGSAQVTGDKTGEPALIEDAARKAAVFGQAEAMKQRISDAAKAGIIDSNSSAFDMASKLMGCNLIKKAAGGAMGSAAAAGSNDASDALIGQPGNLYGSGSFSTFTAAQPGLGGLGGSRASSPAPNLDPLAGLGLPTPQQTQQQSATDIPANTSANDPSATPPSRSPTENGKPNTANDPPSPSDLQQRAKDAGVQLTPQIEEGLRNGHPKVIAAVEHLTSAQEDLARNLNGTSSDSVLTKGSPQDNIQHVTGSITTTLDSPAFQALPPDLRSKTLDSALAGISQRFAGQWDKDTWHQAGQFAIAARTKVASMQSANETRQKYLEVGDPQDKGKWASGVIPDFGRMLGRSGIAAAADASTFNGDPNQPFWRVPGQNIGNGLNLGLKNAADTLQVWGSQLIGDQKDFNEAFNQFATKLKNGDFPFNDATKLRAWMADNAQTLGAQQAKWYDAAQGTDWNHGYAVTNGLQSPRNAALLAGYMRTRDPQALEQLRQNLLVTPQRAGWESEENDRLTTDPMTQWLSKTFGVDYKEPMKEAPANLAAMFFPLGEGVKAGEAGASVLGGAGKAAGEAVLVGNTQMAINNPNATWQQHVQASQDMVIMGLGLGGVGYAGSKLVDGLKAPTTEPMPAPSGTVSNPKAVSEINPETVTPEPGATETQTAPGPQAETATDGKTGGATTNQPSTGTAPANRTAPEAVSTPPENGKPNTANEQASPEPATSGDQSKPVISGGKWDQWADQTLADSRKRFYTGVDPTVLAAYGIKGAALIENGVRKFPEWSERMVKEYGEPIRQHLDDLWKQANDHLKNGLSDEGAGLAEPGKSGNQPGATTAASAATSSPAATTGATEAIATPADVTPPPPNTPLAPIDFDHVIGADRNAAGNPTGGHSLLRGDVRIIPGTEGTPNPQGVYEARVQMAHPTTGAWLNKTSNHGVNSMFPKSWDEAKIKSELDAAWRDPAKTISGNRWTSITPSGVRVEGYISPRIIAYPRL